MNAQRTIIHSLVLAEHRNVNGSAETGVQNNSELFKKITQIQIVCLLHKAKTQNEKKIKTAFSYKNIDDFTQRIQVEQACRPWS